MGSLNFIRTEPFAQAAERGVIKELETLLHTLNIGKGFTAFVAVALWLTLTTARSFTPSSAQTKDIILFFDNWNNINYG